MVFVGCWEAPVTGVPIREDPRPRHTHTHTVLDTLENALKGFSFHFKTHSTFTKDRMTPERLNVSSGASETADCLLTDDLCPSNLCHPRAKRSGSS